MTVTTSPTPATSPGTELVFPPGFVWGAATAAFQIEGAAAEDGRVPSIWDTFCRVPGAVANGDTGDVACDHYHRWPEDVALMADLGLGAYRFSTAWPRICPEPGTVNRAGLDFYSRLVDGLLERGIEPWLTLYHWDLPQSLEDRGGWASRETVDHFVEYALVVQGALGDRVRRWTTLNEPWCSAFLGYAGGQHAPGRQEPAAAVGALHHLLLAHGRAVTAMRAVDPTADYGITLNMSVFDPADPGSPADVAAADREDALLNRVFAEPVLLGRYPQVALDAYASVGVAPPVHDGDLAEIAAPIDFLGINYYNGAAVTAQRPTTDSAMPTGAPVERTTSSPSVAADPVWSVSRGLPRTAMDWEVQPDGLRRVLERAHTDWTGPAGIPIHVTENGAAYDDDVAPDGSVPDADRTAYILEHLRAVHAAMGSGADVRGYFAWSLLDNFEWAYGYEKRFGIVRVDFDTLERTPKDSAHAFARVARTGRLGEEPRGGTVVP
ncbi:GH1 family beta-glucosidase [Cellulomonas carbonis]|uniref:Beta-glucosidase n=1 Tax=Cellulomonas carbonis T26 TaxID=947969 RepID=A0A0A0BTI4_9CELL|nr:GH1 family beta-glucosidase [Cellulomonas carbonis]KGM11220.1 beta-glucosidase [Cellulomonas carbonis T26]GGC10851.1 beta-glucosidase [Cellulomonas carbonis]